VAHHLGQVLALVQPAVALTELAHNLLGRVPVSLHRGVLLPSILGVGLPQQVDDYPGRVRVRWSSRAARMIRARTSGRPTFLPVPDQCPFPIGTFDGSQLPDDDATVD
jgi:hypothetical protein